MSKQLTREQWHADFTDYRRVYGYKTGTYDFIRCFLNWCSRTYPDDPYLRQEMLNAWRAKRPTEKEESHGNRASSLNKFLTFVNDGETFLTFKGDALEFEFFLKSLLVNLLQKARTKLFVNLINGSVYLI